MKLTRGVAAVAAAALFGALITVASPASAAGQLDLRGRPATQEAAEPSPAVALKKAKARFKAEKREWRSIKKNTTTRAAGKGKRDLVRAKTCYKALRTYAADVKADRSFSEARYFQAINGTRCPYRPPVANDPVYSYSPTPAQAEGVKFWSTLALPSNVLDGPGNVAHTPSEAKALLRDYPDMPRSMHDFFIKVVGATLRGGTDSILQIRRSPTEGFVTLIGVDTDGNLRVSHTRGGRGNTNLSIGIRFVFNRDQVAEAARHIGMTWSSELPAGDGHWTGTPSEHPDGLKMWYAYYPDSDEWSGLTFFG